MKRIGVREFKDKATSLISGEETLVVEKHGKPVGFYIPLPRKDVDAARQAARELESTLEGIISRRGLTREDLERAWKETA